MHTIPDWKLEGWGFAQPGEEAPAADPSSGRPAASFVSDGGLRVRIAYERNGEMSSVCFSGPGLTAAGLPHVAKLASDGRKTISDWVIAYEAGRSPEVRKQEAEMRELLTTVGGDPRRLGIPKHLLDRSPFADLAESFAPPPRPGRAGHSDTYLAAQAREYVKRCVVGGEKLSAVAADNAMSQPTFSTQLRAARERGLLTGKPKRGAVEGELTPKAERLLSTASTTTEGDTDGQH